MAELITGLRPEAIRAQMAKARRLIAQAAQSAGRDPAAIEVLVATKYVPAAEMPKLAEAGVTLVGENRAQDLQEKARACGQLFRWDFIGQLQSRKVKAILPHVRLIHSLASLSALAEIERHRDLAAPGVEVLLEVNVSGEEGKAGIAPEEVPIYMERCPLPVSGLMTMPPAAADPEQSRRWFSALRELAQQHGLSRLSMGSTQDYLVAVQEGATIVRLGRSVLMKSVASM